MSEQLPSETKLDELKRLCEPMGGEPMRMVSRLELLALVECAEALRDLYDEQNGPPLERRAQQWHNANERASTALANLEAL